VNVDYINPFIESVYGLFATMLTAKASRGNVAVARDGGPPHDVVALIGLSGPARGMVTLAFPAKTALNIVNRLLGTELHIMDDTVSDAIAEVVNIVAGGAKARFKIEKGPPIELSLPTVVRGNSFCVDYPTKTTWLEVPFDSELGPFTMRVTFKMDAKKGGA
jgi:chemotaxis protein CheX